jgi:hypothetical protein
VKSVNGISATELQLMACFGAEPRLRDPDVPWCYNDAAYTAEVGGTSVTFAVAPAYRYVRFDVRCSGRRLFSFEAVGVADVSVIDELAVDAVEITLAEGS